MAALLAGVSCFQLTGEREYLELPRRQIAAVTARGRVAPLKLGEMSLMELWVPQLSGLAGRTVFDPVQDGGNAARSTIIGERLQQHEAAAGDAVVTPTFQVPYRVTDSGWHDFQPLPSMYSAMLWNVCADEHDAAALRALRAQEGYEWSRVFSFRTKEDAGHEPPWFCYLQGENDDFRACAALHCLPFRRPAVRYPAVLAD